MHLNIMNRILKTSIIFFFTIGWLFYSIPTSQSAVIYKNEFPDSYEFGEKILKLRGGGLKRYLGFKVWVSCIYLQEEVVVNEVLSDIPKKLEIQYLLKIPGAEIARATEVGLENNLSPAAYKKLEEKINLVNSLWPNVKKGDRYEVAYIPGQGTSFVFNGQLQQVIEGADFASAFFSIWIGKKPIDKKLRKQMLNIKK